MNENFTFFYSNKSPFSQWYKADFEVDGLQYNCAEQFMMHQKALLFNDEEMAEAIMSTSNPGKQKAFGRKVKGYDNEVWHEESRNVVYKANEAKFTQNENLNKRLFKTEGTTLVEASPYDLIWGVGMSVTDPRINNPENWLGTNWLGETLTNVREDLLSSDHEIT
jgi:ribA/ribD-fused uncharacterized protein